ncbi:UCH-domain-containing protein [Imleria badia]|nr:UCH-domain-containing protein [Imleria badia]
MESDSSSLKRAASEGPRATNDPPTTDTANDIDAYMAEQGEHSLDAVTLMPPPTPPHDPPANLTPTEKLSYVTQRRLRQMQVGDTWYIVSRRWYRRWEIACQGIPDKSGPIDEKDLGPVDNTPLVDHDANLVSNLTEGVDVEFVPWDVWKAFTTWYGPATHPLPRSVIARGHLGEPSLELRPPRLKALSLVDSQSDGPIGPAHNYVTLSIKDTVRALSRELVASVSARSNVPHRIWKIQPGEYAGSQFPASKLAAHGAELLEINDKAIEDALIEFDDPFVVEFQQDGKWIADQTPTMPTSAAPSVPPPLFGGDDFFSRLTKSSATTSVTQVQPRQVPSPAPSAASTAKAQDSQLAPFKSFGFSKNRAPQEPGTLGLGNMGNTCFMNSALQCLAHTKELTDYFLSGVYQNELNPDNPLGMGGAIAEAFGALLHRIWAQDSTSTSYSPREFKMQLQRFAPQFSGYQQHDSQELVAFLLDGLHEDLNRVLKKPYVEKPDWEGGGDLELAQLAQKSWHGYMQRNDSVIVDLFQGQYQSTLVCPECQKVSITFDPFMYLTLPLPVTKKWKHVVEYIPWDPSQAHVKVPVEIGRDSTFKELRALLGRWMSAPPENLLTLEIFNNRFYKNLDDNVLCGDMSDSDTIVCFELPCNARQSRLYKKKETDPFILPVFVTDLQAVRQSYSYRSQTNFGHPFIVVVDPEQARSIQAIYEAAADRLQRWTTHARDLFTWEEVPSVSVDSVPIPVPPMDSLTEIKENGEVVRVEDMDVDEGDIVDEKAMIQDDATMDTAPNGIPQIVGFKKDIFNLRLQAGQKDFGTGYSSYSSSSQRFESWETRLEEIENGAPLLREMDALYCDFDENLKMYYFGDEASHWEHARWTNTSWNMFLHPEYAEAKKAASEKQSKGLSIDDCLTEFTKEEQLGEDDLWYCPRCQKHQQATKKFDLWRVPDVLAVHLKRFSNSRALRDKIDAFVDFPVQGLDLTNLVGERKVGQKLAESGIDIEGLGIGNVEEPLIYDLYAVDEHLGGLGGGHYRAYALNHVNEQWYHFDDSYVTKSEAYQAVNANAYLLFYKRRSNEPLGGKTHYKIEEARLSVDDVVDPTPSVDTQLPTPPNENVAPTFVSQKPQNSGWRTPASRNRSTPSSSPPPLDELPSFEESQHDQITGLNSLLMDDEQTFRFPSSFKASPTSSNEVEADDEGAADHLRGLEGSPIQLLEGEWHQLSSSSPSPIDSDSNPFSDVNSQKNEIVDNDEIPRT